LIEFCPHLCFRIARNSQGSEHLVYPIEFAIEVGASTKNAQEENQDYQVAQRQRGVHALTRISSTDSMEIKTYGCR
jgi:hypothetical protein